MSERTFYWQSRMEAERIQTKAASIRQSSAPKPALVVARALKRRATKQEARVSRTTHTTTRAVELEEYIVRFSMMLGRSKFLRGGCNERLKQRMFRVGTVRLMA